MKAIRFFRFLAIIFLFIYALGASFLYISANIKSKQLTQRVEELESLKQKLEGETSQLTLSSEALQKENEQLKSASLNYLKKQKEADDNIEKLKTELENQFKKTRSLKQELIAAEKYLSRLKQDNQRLSDVYKFSGNALIEKQQAKIAQLEEDLLSASRQMKQQEARLHYNLGVAYSKDRNYDIAIEEYQRALALNPDDADTHYNLAIIYDDCNKNPKRAIEHYKKYLELKPEAADIDEIKEWIDRLEK